jgi:hypothetical protein
MRLLCSSGSRGCCPGVDAFQKLIQESLDLKGAEIELLDVETAALIETCLEVAVGAYGFIQGCRVSYSRNFGRAGARAWDHDRHAGRPPYRTRAHLQGKRKDQGQTFCLVRERRGNSGALYGHACCDLNSNPTIKSFYEKLMEKNKPKKVAILACERKVLVILNAVLRNKAEFHPERVHARKPPTPPQTGQEAPLRPTEKAA